MNSLERTGLRINEDLLNFQLSTTHSCGIYAYLRSYCIDCSKIVFSGIVQCVGTFNVVSQPAFLHDD